MIRNKQTLTIVVAIIGYVVIWNLYRITVYHGTWDAVKNELVTQINFQQGPTILTSPMFENTRISTHGYQYSHFHCIGTGGHCTLHNVEIHPTEFVFLFYVNPTQAANVFSFMDELRSNKAITYRIRLIHRPIHGGKQRSNNTFIFTKNDNTMSGLFDTMMNTGLLDLRNQLVIYGNDKTPKKEWYAIASKPYTLPEFRLQYTGCILMQVFIPPTNPMKPLYGGHYLHLRRNRAYAINGMDVRREDHGVRIGIRFSNGKNRIINQHAVLQYIQTKCTEEVQCQVVEFRPEGLTMVEEIAFLSKLDVFITPSESEYTQTFLTDGAIVVTLETCYTGTTDETRCQVEDANMWAPYLIKRYVRAHAYKELVMEGNKQSMSFSYDVEPRDIYDIVTDTLLSYRGTS